VVEHVNQAATTIGPATGVDMTAPGQFTEVKTVIGYEAA
jgi:hypothetical protein